MVGRVGRGPPVGSILVPSGLVPIAGMKHGIQISVAAKSVIVTVITILLGE